MRVSRSDTSVMSVRCIIWRRRLSAETDSHRSSATENKVQVQLCLSYSTLVIIKNGRHTTEDVMHIMALYNKSISSVCVNDLQSSCSRLHPACIRVVWWPRTCHGRGLSVRKISRNRHEVKLATYPTMIWILLMMSVWWQCEAKILVENLFAITVSNVHRL